MRISVVSDDGQTVSEHFGRAPFYVVLDVEDGRIVARETRGKDGHRTFARQHHQFVPGPGERRGYSPGSENKHHAMAETIDDCHALLAGGMGWGAFESMRARSIEPVITDVRDVDEAALRYARGDLPNLMERLH